MAPRKMRRVTHRKEAGMRSALMMIAVGTAGLVVGYVAGVLRVGRT